jgi:GcrA cell cycle regulator
MEWTQERIAALKTMWQDGLSASEVARKLGGVSRGAVIGKVHRLGIAGRDLPSRPGNVGGRPSGRLRASAGGVPRPSAAPRPPRPAPAPRIVFEATPTASLITLTEHGCRWPIGDPDAPGFGFCGRLRADYGAYCSGHASMATRRGTSGTKPRMLDRFPRSLDRGPT